MIDINRDITRTAKYSLNEEELVIFNSLEGYDKTLYFYKKWVQKEAHFKKIGKGLTKEFANTVLDYPIYNLQDNLGNNYVLSTTQTGLGLEEIKLNILEDITF